MSNRLGYNGGRFYDFLTQPVRVDCNFVVDATNGLGITSLNGAGVKNVFMHTSTTPTSNNGYLNPNPAAGYALIQLKSGYIKYSGGFTGFAAPLTGSALAINGSALTVGAPNTIVTVGAGTKGAVTIAPVADSSGSLASTWFKIFDPYGNTFIVWFSVSGVGTAPTGVSGTLVQQSITTGDSAATIGAALVVTLAALPALQPGNPSAPAGVFGFTAAGTTTVTVTSTVNAPLPGGPADGAVATGFTFAVTKDQTNTQNWQAVGLPKGVVPAVGASFIATATGYSTRGGSTGTTKLSTVSGISAIEVIGDANQSISPIAMGGSPNNGAWILVQFLAPSTTAVTSVLTMASYTPAGTNNGASPPIFAGTPAVLTGTIANSGGVSTLAVTAPTAGSLVRMSFIVESKNVIIAGE